MLRLNNHSFLRKYFLVLLTFCLSVSQVLGQCPLDLNETSLAPTDDMLLHLPLDGNLSNLGSGTYTMNISGATYTSTQCGQGLSFDGIDDYLTVSPSMNLVNDYTVTAWINPNAQVDWMGIFAVREQCVSTYRGYSIAQLSLGDYNINTLSNQINKHQNCTGFSGGDRYTDPSIIIPNNEETFVALTVQNNSSENRQVYLYVNCQEFSTTMTIDMPTNVCFNSAIDYITTIGASSSIAGQTSTFDGTIDEIRVYDRVLSSDELLDVYQSCLPLDISITNFSNCMSDSAQITIYNSQLNVNYQLIDATTNAPIGSFQPGNCGPIFFSTGIVSDTSSFQIEAINTITNCSIILDTTITIYPTSNEFNATQTMSLCFGDSVLIDNQYISNAGTYIDTIPISPFCDSIITYNLDIAPQLSVDLGADFTICNSDTTVLYSNYSNFQNVWSDGSTADSLLISESGIYWIEVIDTCGNTYSDSILVHDISVTIDLGNDTLLCDGTQMLLDASGSITSSYLWSNGATTPTINISNSGTYWVEVNDQGCSRTDTINISTDSIPEFSLSPDTTICSGNTLSMSSPIQNSQLVWSTGATSNTINITQPGIYTLMATNICGSYSDSIIVDVNQSPEVFLGIDTSICEGETHILTTNLPNTPTIWQNGSTSSTFPVTQSGIYFVEVVENGCVATDTIDIQVIQPPVVQLHADTIICMGDYLKIVPEGIGNSYLWNNGSTSQTIYVSIPGEYSVTVQNKCGSASDQINIGVQDCFCSLYVPNTFTPDDDNFNDNFKLILDCPIEDFELLVFNRWGEILFESHSIEDNWDASYMGKKIKIGTYIYRVKYKVIGEQRKVIYGHVNVLY